MSTITSSVERPSVLASASPNLVRFTFSEWRKMIVTLHWDSPLFQLSFWNYISEHILAENPTPIIL